MTRAVGLQGEQITIARVRSPIAAMIRSASNAKSSSSSIETMRALIPSSAAILTYDGKAGSTTSNSSRDGSSSVLSVTYIASCDPIVMQTFSARSIAG